MLFFSYFRLFIKWLINIRIREDHLIDSVGWTHRTLDVQRSNVLPVLLQQRDQEVDGQVDVGGQLFQLHANIANSNGQTQDLERERQITIRIYSIRDRDRDLRHAFFIWNLMVLFNSSTLAGMLSPWLSGEGNLPALLRPRPRTFCNCLITVSEARKASYELANFLTFLFSLFNFLRSSRVMHGMLLALASSQCFSSPNTHTRNFGFGTYLSLN